MRRAASMTFIAVFAALPFVSTGCAPQDRYDDLLTANRSLREQLVVVEDERDGARASIQAVQDRLAQSESSYDALQHRYLGLEDALNRLEGDNDGLLERIANQQFGPLPSDVEFALSRLAAEYPHLLSFDARLGMLRFASDFTFNSGRATVRDEAAQTVAEVARILQSGAAAGLEVRVVGHTDNVPIQYSKARNPTNMHLSINRAIAVRDALVSSGIDPVRIQAAGYGEFRPLVANQAGGTTENRRVEIFLLPMPDLDVRLTSTPVQLPAETTGATADATSDEPMK